MSILKKGLTFSIVKDDENSVPLDSKEEALDLLSEIKGQ